jgi:hypothetical protein
MSDFETQEMSSEDEELKRHSELTEHYEHVKSSEIIWE